MIAVATALLGLGVLIGAVLMAGLALTVSGPYGGPSRGDRIGMALMCACVALGGLVLLVMGVRMWP